MTQTGSTPRVALVTGAASGIGRAVVAGLAQAGWTVAMCDCDADGLEAARFALQGQGSAALRSFVCDVRSRAQVDDTVRAIEEHLGPVQALVSAAGVLLPGTLLDVEDSAWAESFAVNAAGVLHLARAVLPRMVQRKSGAMVTVASNAARTPRIGMAAYSASKAAALMLTKCFGLEVAQHGVRCNVVCPGSTDTPMLQTLWRHGGSRDHTITGSLAQYRLGIPLGRIATPEDVADVVLYLLSDRSRHITLQEICVDGGATL